MDPNDSSNFNVVPERVQTAKWTRYIPEAFGLREAVQKSKYRWCTREGAMWGIATGTTIFFHRLRMGSTYRFATNSAFVSIYGVFLGSYYFCYKRRDHEEAMIAEMMRFNEWQHISEMGPEIPIDDDHPFLLPLSSTDTTSASDSSSSTDIQQQQYVIKLPERKEWQPPLPPQDAADVFNLPKRDDKK